MKGKKGFQKGHKCFTLKHSERSRKNNSEAKKGNKNPMWKGGEPKKICLNCGVEFPSRYKSDSQYCSRVCSDTNPLRRKKLSKIRSKRRGKLSPNWRGGISSLNRIIRQSKRYEEWVSDIFQRDNWICQTCGRRSKVGDSVKLEAHHIWQFIDIIRYCKIMSFEDALTCEELWNINNGITLCGKCHNLTKRGNKTK